jgi:acetyl-CoA synthetase
MPLGRRWTVSQLVGSISPMRPLTATRSVRPAGRSLSDVYSRNGGVRDITYGELSELTSRFAQALDHLGVGVGDRVFVLLPRVPELYVAALGTLKHRSVLSPLFSAFGPEPIRQRLEIGEGRVLVTTAGLFRRRVASQRDALRTLEHVLDHRRTSP